MKWRNKMFENLTNEQIKVLAYLLKIGDFKMPFNDKDWIEAGNIEGEVEQEITKRNLWHKEN
jgi:hypothetical protein